MHSFSRSLYQPADLGSPLIRRLAVPVLAAMVSLALGLLLTATPAGASVALIEGQKYGVAPAAATADPTHPLAYEQGPVVHASANYLLFWSPQIARTAEYPDGGYSGDSMRIIDAFFRNFALDSAGTDNVFGVATQYREGPTGPAPAYSASFRGAYTDTNPFPTGERCARGSICVTASQIRTELAKYIAANSLPSGLNPANGVTPVYFVLTPPGVDVCAGGAGAKSYCSEPESGGRQSPQQICSYHSFIPAESGHQTILYAVLPWSAGNAGTPAATPRVSGSACQDGSGTLQEPNQIGLGANGEYNAGLADVIVNQAADEQLATVTDPLFTGWHDTITETGNTDEVPDKCRYRFLGGLLTEPPASSVDAHTEAGSALNQLIAGTNYYINDEFNQAGLFEHYPGVACINQVNIAPQFTAQSDNSSEELTFNASESDVALGISKYRWEFGDKTSTEINCGAHTPTNGAAPEECDSSPGVGNPNPVASVVHKYAYGGTYQVTLTVTDDGGNTASVTQSIIVAGPAEPPPAPAAVTPAPSVAPAAAATGSSTTGSSAPSPLASSPAVKVLPGPVASQAVLSHSLASVLSKGLVIRYSVNEQVAGQFQVLLAASLAKRIGLHGALATGLPAGSVPSIVIGKAILITTKGGRNTVKIQFGKRTAQKLRKLKTVPLTIRLVVRNASSHTPLSTTVISAVTLTR